jgi:DNA-binding phage protein
MMETETETETAPYDVAEFLETPEEMATFLEACIQESDGDAAFIAKAWWDSARARGMTNFTSRDSGLFLIWSVRRGLGVRAIVQALLPWLAYR